MTDEQDSRPRSPDPRSNPAFEGLLASYIEKINLRGFVDPDEILDDQPELGPALVEDLQAYVRLQRAGDETGPLGTIGDFTLRRELGRGGMGIVYDAWQASMERPVALKVLPAGVAVDDRAFQRFMREARAAGKLNHPNVVAVHAVGQDDNTPYYAMELVEGKTLSQILERLRALEGHEKERTKLLQSLSKLFGKHTRESLAGSSRSDPDEPVLKRSLFSNQDVELRYFGHLAVSFAGAADGLQHAHSNGIVHRDIKPSNLILDGHGRLRVLDFGLARQEGQQSLTATDALVGTPLYMSPEQAQARRVPIDHRTDIYSLGATLYEMLTGRPPIEGRTPQDTLSQIISRDPAPPRHLQPRIPRDLETIVLKCLRKEPKDRFGTAEALAQDLRRFARADPIEARPRSPVEKLLRRVKRHAVKLGLLGLAVLLLVVSGLLLHQYRVNQAEAQAAEERAALEEYRQTVTSAVSRIQVAEMGLHVLDARESGLDPKGYFTALRLDSLVDDRTREPLDQAISGLERALAEAAARNAVVPISSRIDGHEALYHLARALKLRGDHALALGKLRELREIRPNFVPAMVLEAEVQRMLGRDEEAAEIEKAAATVAGESAAGEAAASWVRLWLDARQAESDQRWTDAVQAYEQLVDSTVSRKPPYEGFRMETRLRRGLAHLEAGELAAAAADFAVARHEWPEALQPALHLGRTLCIQGSGEEAERVFLELYESQLPPRRDLAVAWIVLTYSYEDQWERTLQWAERLSQEVLRERMRSLFLSQLKRFDEAEEVARELIATHPDDAVARHALAVALRGRKKPDPAMESCKRALELDPENFGPYVTLSQILDDLGQLGKCVEPLRAALKLEPENSMLLGNLGTVLVRLGKAEEALELLEESYRIRPNAVACTFLTLALEKTQQNPRDPDIVQRRVKLLEEAIELDPEYYPAWVQLGVERYQHGRNTLDGIEKLLTAARLKPDVYVTHLHLGRAFESLGLDDDALEHYLKATELVYREGMDEKQHLSGLMTVGNRLSRGSSIPEVREKGLALLRQAGGDPRFAKVSLVLSDLSSALIENGQYQEAFDVSGRALRIDTGHPIPFLNRGIAHGKLGRPRDALQDFLAALRAGREKYFVRIAENITDLFREHRDADFGEPLERLKSGLEAEAAKGTADPAALWSLWLTISLWVERRPVEEVLERIETVAGKAPAGSGNGGDGIRASAADLRWALEQLRDQGVLRLNCGGEEHRDSSGTVWGADRFFLSGTALDVRDEIREAKRSVPEITGCDDPAIYQVARRFLPGPDGPPAYRLPVLPGNYRVTLHFVEMAHVPSLARTFSIELEGKPVLDKYKPQRDGVAKAIRKTFEVQGTAALLTILLKPTRGVPQLSAIELEKLKGE